MKKDNKNGNVLSILDGDYQNWIKDLKKRYRQSQIKAAISINASLLEFYFELGKDISYSSFKANYGDDFYNKLSKDLNLTIKDAKGFSPRNLRYI